MDRPERRPGQGHLGLCDRASDPEVGDLHPAVAADQDVAGLHVAVDDPARMGCLECPGGLGHDSGRLARRQGAGAADDRRQVLALDKLHDDERPGCVLTVVVDRDDVRVVERGRVLGLLAEPRSEVGISTVLGSQELDRHVAIELVVVRAEDRRHAALSEQLNEPVAPAEDRSDLRHMVLRAAVVRHRLRRQGR